MNRLNYNIKTFKLIKYELRDHEQSHKMNSNIKINPFVKSLIFFNLNILKTHIFHKLKYDLKGQPKSFCSLNIAPPFLKLDQWSPGAGFLPIISIKGIYQIKKKIIK